LLSKSVKIKRHKIIILPDLYDCGTWFLTLGKKKEACLVFEKSELRRIFGLKRNEVTGENYLYNENIKMCTDKML
jgi:hypothetical protein